MSGTLVVRHHVADYAEWQQAHDKTDHFASDPRSARPCSVPESMPLADRDLRQCLNQQC